MNVRISLLEQLYHRAKALVDELENGCTLTTKAEEAFEKVEMTLGELDDEN